MNTDCQACAQLKAARAPFRCNRCRRATPTLTDKRRTIATALVTAHGVPLAEAERIAFTAMPQDEVDACYAVLTSA